MILRNRIDPAAAILPAKKVIARTRTLTGFQILGVGSYVPESVVTNADLNQDFGLEAGWVFQRTGIRERRHLSKDQATSDLCIEAGRAALADARVAPEAVDLAVVGTFTPDMAIPSTACILQEGLGLFCGAFDVQAACSGFMYALSVGAQFIKTGNANRCLVVGADANSRVVDPTDPKTYPLFGDGAGAVVIGPGDVDQGFLAYQLGSDGAGGDLLNRPACGSRLPPTAEVLDAHLQYLKMDGRAVYRWAIHTVTDSILEVLAHAGLEISDVRWFLPHQANIRIINAVADVLGFPRSRVFNNLDRYGNTSSASIPLILAEAQSQGAIERGDLVLLSGFGGGLTWGTAVLRW